MSRLVLILAASASLLAACGGEKVYHHDERFDANSAHRREFNAGKVILCDAGRHVLLDQGYLVSRQDEGREIVLVGQKEFREQENRHATLQVQIVCSERGEKGLLFVTAMESHYDVAQTKEKTSVGLPLVAPVSISSSTTSDGQIKRSGETVDDRSFYDSLFRAVERELGSK